MSELVLTLIVKSTLVLPPLGGVPDDGVAESLFPQAPRHDDTINEPAPNPSAARKSLRSINFYFLDDDRLYPFDYKI
jgi:hypothetical protein